MLAASFCTLAPQQVGGERTNMNSTVADGDEVQEYDDLAGFSPVDSSSVWEVCGGADDFAVVKEEFVESCHNWCNPWGSPMMQSPMQPVPVLKSSGSRRSIRDILREVMVSEETLQCAVARLGGGAQGLQVLMDHVHFWASEPRDADVPATIRQGILDLASRGMGVREPACSGAAYTRALRKSHMVRQRGNPTRAQRGHHSKSQCGHQSRPWRTGARQQSWLHELEPELGSANGKGYEFLFQKELRASDVSSLGRIVLPKKDAERHLPFLMVREGVMLTLEDYHSGTFWTVRYRFWPNNKSRMYLLENIGGFVTYHRLQEGDLLLCYRNAQGGYVIRGQKVPRSVKASAKGSLSSKGAHAKTTETKSTMNSAAMPPTAEAMEGGQSTTTGTTDSTSFDSLECTLRELSDGFEDGYGATQQMDYRDSAYEDGGCKPPLLHDSSFDPVMAMLSVSNVKQRYMDGEEFLKPE